MFWAFGLLASVHFCQFWDFDRKILDLTVCSEKWWHLSSGWLERLENHRPISRAGGTASQHHKSDKLAAQGAPHTASAFSTGMRTAGALATETHGRLCFWTTTANRGLTLGVWNANAIRRAAWILVRAAEVPHHDGMKA